MFNHSCLWNTKHQDIVLSFPFLTAVSKAYCILTFASFFPLLTNCRCMHFSFDPSDAYHSNINGLIESNVNDAKDTLAHSFKCRLFFGVCLTYSTVFLIFLWHPFNILAHSWMQTQSMITFLITFCFIFLPFSSNTSNISHTCFCEELPKKVISHVL